ncbi:hypothetical protein pdam_00018525 [Pocillopora damicornis]|uniref:Mediator of RNA polymerase II transcription subunit 1 n=1 Tax=Pocillopora damicornis TaxID=46731 RepID=A0A3M6TBJ4_POCDA|nr:hypothetical protein pdam_00018525 [Pocillopora damicornis]
MAAAVEMRTCGSCCLQLKELVNSYEEELGLKGKEFDGTKIHAFGSLNFYLEHSKFNDLLNSIRSKCKSCASWPDPAKAIRASQERQQQVENLAPVKNYISECLDKLQNAMKDKSIKVVAQRLEAITRKVGLKFIESGRECFINSDMFYVEVRMAADGTVSEVKVAHTGDPEARDRGFSCPELTRVLREGDYNEFLCHLQGLCDLYQLSRDTFQKPKVLAALKAVETDINTMAAFFGTDVTSTEAITQCPVGFITPRQGGSLLACLSVGRRMRLCYFASPYELLDVNRPGQDRHFTREEPPPRDFGYQVYVSLEQSQDTSLPISPLITEPCYSMLGLDASVLLVLRQLERLNQTKVITTADQKKGTFLSELKTTQEPNSEDYLFELRSSEPFTLTVTFEHPCTSSMASKRDMGNGLGDVGVGDVGFGDDDMIKATLTTVPGKPLFCSNDYISRVTQRCLSIPAAMRCIIRKAQSVKLEELPVKASEELLLPVGGGQPSTKLASLSLPSSAALFGAAVGTPSNPNTPVFLGTSPSFTGFNLETPSPTFSAFTFSSISPTFSFNTTDITAAAADSLTTTAAKQPEKKPEAAKTPNLKITLKRKRDDEYVIENFQLPDEVPKSAVRTPVGQTPSKSKETPDPESMEGDNFPFDLAAVSGANFTMGTTFPDVSAGLDGSVVVAAGSSTAGQHVGLAGADSLAAASGLGIVSAGIEGLSATADLFDIGGAGADGTDLEGILQNLSGASHLPPGIVSGATALDFETGLGAGVPGLDVSDPGFDIDAALDASAVADPSIAGTAGAFDVDSTLGFDLDNITGVGGLPPEVTGAADLLAVSGLSGSDVSVDIDMPGTSHSKI